MPSHKTHDKIGTMLLIPILIISIPILILYVKMSYLNIFINIIIFSISYLFATYFLSPDLDINSKVFDRWKVLKIFWCPYKELFKHRQLSHNIIFGPISIISYFTFLIIGFLLLIHAIPDTLDMRIIIIYIAFFISIEIHIISDIIIKPKKKKKKNKRKK